MGTTLRLLFSLFLFFPFAISFCATLGDRILEERQERMRAASERINPLRGVKIPSSLENLENVGEGVQLITENADGISITLLEAVRKALQDNPLLSSQVHKIEAVRELASARPTARRLTADFKTGLNLANNLDNDPRDFKHRRLFDISHRENSLYFGMDMRFPLLDGGKSAALIEQGTLEEQLEKIRQKDQRQKVLASVATTYVNLVLLDEKLRLSDLLIELSRHKSKEEERKPTRDPRFPVELLNARIELDQALQNRINLRAQKRMESARLRTLIGWNESQRFRLDKNARTRVVRESLDSLIKSALRDSPRLKELTLLQKIEDQKRKALHSTKEIGLDLMGKTSYTKLVESQGIDEIRYLVGFELKTNLTDSRRTVKKMNSNREGTKALEKKYTQEEALVRSELFSTFQLYQDYKKRIPAHLDNAKLARQVQLEAEERFQTGGIPTLRLMGSRVQFQKALLAYYQALKDLIHTKLKLFELSGMLDEEVFG